jgi:hypothetical protein
MVHKTGVSFRAHAYEKIWRAKPRNMGFSEWVETLALQGLESRPVAELEKNNAPARISTPPSMPHDSSCLLVAVNHAGKVVAFARETQPLGAYRVDVVGEEVLLKTG